MVKEKNIAKRLLQGLKELNSFDIIHTDIKPENVALVLERHDFTSDQIISQNLSQERMNYLYGMEIALICIFFYKILKTENTFEIFFDEKIEEGAKNFTGFCLENRKCVKFFQPPFRKRMLEEGKDRIISYKI